MIESDSSKLKTDEGNTIPHPTRRSRSWTLTINNYTEEEYNKLTNSLSLMKCKYIIGKEIGEQGTPHLQGYIKFKNQRTLQQCKKINNRAHWEIAKGNEKQNFDYCSKDLNFKAEGFESKQQLRKKEALKKYFNTEWKPWQADLIEYLEKNEPNARTINWYYEQEGNKGKSYLAKYLYLIYNTIIADGKKDNIFHQIKTMITEENIEPELVILDIPRCNEGYVNYGAIEEIKNGLILSGKYESSSVIFDNVHVVVFANFPPDEYKLSKDRWNIVNI